MERWICTHLCTYIYNYIDTHLKHTMAYISYNMLYIIIIISYSLERCLDLLWYPKKLMTV